MADVGSGSMLSTNLLAVISAIRTSGDIRDRLLALLPPAVPGSASSASPPLPTRIVSSAGPQRPTFFAEIHFETAHQSAFAAAYMPTDPRKAPSQRISKPVAAAAVKETAEHLYTTAVCPSGLARTDQLSQHGLCLRVSESPIARRRMGREAEKACTPAPPKPRDRLIASTNPPRSRTVEPLSHFTASSYCRARSRVRAGPLPLTGPAAKTEEVGTGRCSLGKVSIGRLPRFERASLCTHEPST
ncbi:hypothetical protein ANO11243_076480 [Dothideomycetidae sp. 11243]|nr:hypothetical protein ANO11243_076480 [fungal sp. No.11243]